MLKIITCTDNNQLIGKENGLPWNLPEDLKYFNHFLNLFYTSETTSSETSSINFLETITMFHIQYFNTSKIISNFFKKNFILKKVTLFTSPF